MKKQVLKMLTLIFALTIIFALPMSAEEYLTGDMNGDGVVNTDDAIYLLRHVLQPQNYTLSCNHNLTEHEAKEATCTETGYKAYETCSRCDYTTYEETEATGHNYENRKCTACGEKAPNAPAYSEGLEFTSNGDGTCYVSGIGTCTDTDIVIPTTLPDGDTVTGIGSDAFRNCTSLTSITIPDSVTSIGVAAFEDCDSLASIEFEDTRTWYRTNNSTNWQNMTGGTETDVTNSATNANYFKNTYKGYYWYKK